MSQSLNQLAVNNFVKGLITEAGEMTFPEGASVDELNCDLRRDGSRRRRLGAALEEGYSLTGTAIATSDRVVVGEWTNVNGIAGLTYTVVQEGDTLRFYNKAEAPYSTQSVMGFVDLTSYEHAGSVGSANADCQFTSINGVLIVASTAIDTIVVEGLGSVGVDGVIQFNIRDFEWQGDITTYDNATASPTIERMYDTYNAGWKGSKGSAALATYPNWPALTMPWYAGKDSNGDFSASEWDKIYSGTTLAGNGGNIVGFMTTTRSGLATAIETSRFSTVEAFAGRVFYSGLTAGKRTGNILFSKLVENNDTDLGYCHQQNDPTAEDISDLYPTDGGVINLPDAVGITKLYAFRSSLFVFAENGVWQISGADGIFSASGYSVSKVSKVGIASAASFVAAEGVPIWWSLTGIHTLKFDEVTGGASEQSISLPTIQTFWDSISTEAKAKVRSVYDSVNKRVYWSYPDDDEPTFAKLNNFLVLDLPLQAFFPWRVGDQDPVNTHIVGLSFYSGFGVDEVEEEMLAHGAGVVLSTGEEVVLTRNNPYVTGNPSVVLILSHDGKINMGGFTSTGFNDWGEADYNSFAVAGYNFLGDLTLKKNTPFITVYSRVTETGFSGSGVSGYEAVRPSSLKVSTSWDFKEAFSASQQAYRLKYPVVVDPLNLDNFDYPEDVVTTRLKVRGHGRSVRVKFESEQGKDFVLIGYGVVTGANKRF